MNNPDYKADIVVKCLTDQDEDFTKGQVYECFSISQSGNAKVIDNKREENYLLSDDFEIVEGTVYD